MRSLIYGGIEDVSEGEDPLLVARSPAEAIEIRIETAEITNPSQSRSSHNHPGG